MKNLIPLVWTTALGLACAEPSPRESAQKHESARIIGLDTMVNQMVGLHLRGLKSEQASERAFWRSSLRENLFYFWYLTEGPTPPLPKSEEVRSFIARNLMVAAYGDSRNWEPFFADHEPFLKLGPGERWKDDGSTFFTSEADFTNREKLFQRFAQWLSQIRKAEAHRTPSPTRD